MNVAVEKGASMAVLEFDIFCHKVSTFTAV